MDLGISHAEARKLKRGLTELLKRQILDIRNAIREHRDARGDDRCWLDDSLVYASIPGCKNVVEKLYPKEKFMWCCHEFKKLREHPFDKLLSWKMAYVCMSLYDSMKESFNFDKDLKKMSCDDLLDELTKLTSVCLQHSNKNPKTYVDDEMLYAALPDYGIISAVTKLPDELISNCGRFYDTRPRPTPVSKLHEW